MNKNFQITLDVNRESAKAQGFYDGRFAPKIMPNKKKSVHRKLRKDKKFSLSY